MNQKLSQDSTNQESRGSLPEAKQTRWQPIRGGLLNLYRFDHQEFHFEQGHLLLRGNNGTGKSRVLALQLPFLLDGDVSPARMEPDGDPAKRIEWNLLLGKYDDRLGYTWLEFGRRDEAGQLHYLTLGCGLRAIKGRPQVNKWFFVTRQRIGQDLYLQTSAGQALTRDRLAEAVGDQGKVFTTATEYRLEVDRALFGLGEHRFAALVKLLIQLRQPQLSRELNEKKLSEALSEALPPISENIIADVAESFRGLESERKALDAFKAARNGVTAFLTGYQRYAQIAARRRAEAVRVGHYEYESTMRRLRDAEARRSTAEGDLGRIILRLQQLAGEEQAASSRVATLADSPEMRSARALDEARQLAQQRQEDAKSAQDDLERVKEIRVQREQQQDEAKKAAECAALDVQQASNEAQRYAALAGLEQEHRDAVEVLDLQNLSDVSEIPAAEQLLTEAASGRQKAVEHVRKLNRAIEQAENALAAEKQVHAHLSSQLDDAVEKQQEAHSLLQQAKAGLLEGYRSWFDRLSELEPPEPEDIAESVEAWCETGETKCPIDESADLAGREAFNRLSESRAESQRHLEQIEWELKELRDARDRCAAGWHEPPPLPHTRDNAARETRLGGPLWLLCDFATGVEVTRRAGIEAALEASGLLDAWITPDGRLLAADEHDTVLIAGTSPAVSDDRHLGQILIPSVDRSDSRTKAVSDETVRAILKHIGVGAGAGHVWIDADGRWQVGPLHGAWTKPAEQHIGPAAREADRQRRLKALDVQISDRQRERAAVQDDIDRLANREEVVRSELAQVPDGTEVLRARAGVAAAAREVQDCRRRVTEVETRVVEKRRALETATKQRNLDARDLGIADRVDDLDTLYDAIHMYLRGLAGFWPKVEGYVSARNHAQAADQRTADAIEQEDRFQHRLHEIHKKVQEAIARCDALEAALGAPAQDVQKRLDEARQQLETIRKERDEAVERRVNLNTQVALAKQQIQTEEEKLEQDAARRQLAIDGLKRFAATRLLSLAVPDVVDAEPATWSVTKGVEIARRTEAILDKVDSDDAAWERNQKGIFRQIEELKETLLPYGHQPAATPEDDVLVVTASFRGKDCTMAEFRDALSDEITHHQTLLDAREREVIENHLIGEVAMHLHDRLHEAEQLVRGMDEQITARPTSTGMALHFIWEPIPDGPAGLAEARKRLLGAGGTWSLQDRQALGEFLQQQIQAVRAANETGTWQEHLTTALDYRRWHRFAVERQQDGKWKRLTKRTHGTGSSGEKAIALTLPQFAAAAAYYQTASPTAPRLILLDEAFVSVDTDMRSKCMDLLRAFDLDFVMTSEREWGCYSTLPGVAIYQLATRPGIDAVGVTRWVWNGRQRIRDDQPLPYARPPVAASAERSVPGGNGQPHDGTS